MRETSSRSSSSRDMCRACRATTWPASWQTSADAFSRADQVRRAENRGERIAQLVREHREELLAAAHAFLDFQLRPDAAR